MSQESMDSTVLALYEAFNRRDWTAVGNVASPDVVVEEAPGASPEARTLRGWDQVRAYLHGMFVFWDRVNFEVRRVVWADEHRAVVALRVTLRGRGSGIEDSTDSGTLIEFRDGSIVRATIYRTEDEALEAAGLRE
jgi:ketosteroid isomerase-like protein